MDDDRFKAELLGRLDKICELLSLQCASLGGSERKVQAEAPPQQRIAVDQPNPGLRGGRLLLQDEMQDSYQQALQNWKAGQE